MSKRAYFQGFYVKQQSQNGALALIPARHIDATGQASASLQIITGRAAFRADFPADAFHADSNAFDVHLGSCRFSPQGCMLSVHTQDIRLAGSLYFTRLNPPHGDIMGPFRFAPGMECRHQVVSLGHHVTGCVTLNGTAYRFHNDTGYIEGDRGRSFPEKYVWTQCGWEEGSVMISVASIPLYGVKFTGCIASVLLEGREYRLATYRGVKVQSVSGGCVRLRQGDFTLEAELLEAAPSPLRAPVSGGMTRIIHESLAATVRYRFTCRGATLLELTSAQASFESAWDDPGPCP